VPGEDERPPGDAAPEAARLNAVAARLETLGAALQRSIGETTESTATLSRTVGTVSSDLSRLIGEALAALGQTRKIVLATDDAAGSVAEAFVHVETRLAEVTAELGAIVERQTRIEEDRPDPDALAAAVGAEVGRALSGFADRFAGELDAMLVEQRETRAALAAQVRALAEPAAAPLTDDDVRAQVEAVVAPRVEELREDVAQLAAEVHEDRAVLSRRLAGQNEIEELRELVETLAGHADVVELQELIGALQEAVAETVGRADVEEVVAELQGGLETVIDAAIAAYAPDDAPLERLRTDVLALSDDIATTAKRAGAGQRAVEELRRHIEKDLAAQVERAVVATGGDIRHDTEVLVSELHDDLSLVMRQVVAGNQELEALREAVAELAMRTEETAEGAEPPAGAEADELAPAVRSMGDDVMRAVGDLHEDLSLVLKRLAAGQRELDDVREAILAVAPPSGATAAVDPEELAGAVRDELAGPLRELGDDLSVLVRSVSGTQEELDGLRAAVADLADAVATAGQEADEEEYESAEEEIEAGPDLAELVEGLRVDIDAGLGAAVSDLRDELDSVRKLVAEQAGPLDADAVRVEVDALLADVRDDLAVLAQQLATGQDDVAGFRAEVLETLAAQEPAPLGDDDGATAAEGLAEEVRAEVATLGDEMRGQFERLRQVLGRARSEPPSIDLSEVAPEVAAEVTAAVAPVVSGLHDDLAVLAGQLDDARAALEQLQEASTPSGASEEGGAEVAAMVADLHDDLALVLSQVVNAQQDLQAMRAEIAATDAGATALRQEVAAGQEDVRAVLDALRDEVAALLEITPAGAAPPDLEHLEVAIADLPAIMGAELRAEVEALADELRAGLHDLQGLAAAAGDPGVATGDVEDLRAELQALVNDLQTDLGTVVREIVAGQGEVSQLRAEVATVAEQVGDALADAVTEAVTAAMPPPPVEDPALAIEGMRADVTAGLADMAADLRADLEGLVAELHDDLGTLMNQVVAGQDDLDTLRLALTELASRATGPDLVADDLDRLSRDLQALRDRIPGPADGAATPRRRPRARPQR
jgi:hypothetical protein